MTYVISDAFVTSTEEIPSRECREELPFPGRSACPYILIKANIDGGKNPSPWMLNVRGWERREMKAMGTVWVAAARHAD